MNKTPKSLRLHIALFGRTNVGKSTFLNMMAGQDVAITSTVPGTTTDVVEKTMELLPVGPVLIFDTAGLDDTSSLSQKRIQKTNKIYDRTNLIILIVEANKWTIFEQHIIDEAKKRKIAVIIAVNKIDRKSPSEEYKNKIRNIGDRILFCSAVDIKKRNEYLFKMKQFVFELCPDDFMQDTAIIGDLIPRKSISILIIPIDLEAPKGRLILPQVQTIRDALDNDSAALIVKESEYRLILDNLKVDPGLVVCDSQVVLNMVRETPEHIKCTTFSILFSRYKGDLDEMVKGAVFIDQLNDNDKILIAESCSHHALEDDIGRIKIPAWLKQYTGLNLKMDVCAGKDYPDNLKEYKLIIHCGACMINRRLMLSRIQQAKEQRIPITNYGVVISKLQGVLERVLEPFPSALTLLHRSKQGEK